MLGIPNRVSSSLVFEPMGVSPQPKAETDTAVLPNVVTSIISSRVANRRSPKTTNTQLLLPVQLARYGVKLS